MRWLPFMVVVSLLAGVGCAGERSPHAAKKEFGPVGARIDAGKDAQAGQADAVKQAPEFVALQDEQGPPKGVNPAAAKVNQPRKIRYTSDVKLIVESFAAAEKGLKEAVKEADADIAKGEVNSSPGAIRTGVWKIRVPVKQFDSFREALFALGEVEQNRVDSEDLTAEYYDLETHIKNRRTVENAMRELIKKAGDRDLKTLRELERELESISDEISRKESRLKVMANLTELTTVHLTIREKQQHAKTPPPVVTPPPPTFGTRASETFSGSWASFVGFLQTVAIVFLAVIPWLPLPLTLAGLGWLVVRYVRGRDAPIELIVEETAPSAKT